MGCLEESHQTGVLMRLRLANKKHITHDMTEVVLTSVEHIMYLGSKHGIWMYIVHGHSYKMGVLHREWIDNNILYWEIVAHVSTWIGRMLDWENVGLTASRRLDLFVPLSAGGSPPEISPGSHRNWLWKI